MSQMNRRIRKSKDIIIVLFQVFLIFYIFIVQISNQQLRHYIENYESFENFCLLTKMVLKMGLLIILMHVFLSGTTIRTRVLSLCPHYELFGNLFQDG